LAAFRAVYRHRGELNSEVRFLPERASAVVYTPRRLATQKEERLTANVAVPAL